MSFPDEYWMAKAIALAKKGARTTTSNPNVGCVIVRNDKLIGEGYHKKAGTPHAEIHALKMAGDASGATAYVTLEPCCHYGRTPPCAKALIEAGVSRVVCGMVDPNPQVAGNGLKMLEEAGIETRSGVLETAAEELNPGFLKRMRTGRPFITVKMASSLDGGTALANGESQWITGPEARNDVQTGRALSCAVITGVGTILADNPSLNVRLGGATRQPVRIILDSAGQTPLSSKIAENDGDTIIVHGDQVKAERIQAFHERGFKTQTMPLVDNRIDLLAFIRWCGEQSFNRLWVESGATLAGAFMETKNIDELRLYQAPVFLGADTRPVLKGTLNSIAEAHKFDVKDVRFVGKDIRWVLKPQTP